MNNETMNTMHAHTIKILRKIDPTKKFSEFIYFEEDDYINAAWYDRNEIIKIKGSFYKVEIKDHVSSVEELPNLLVKHGRHVVKELNYWYENTTRAKKWGLKEAKDIGGL